LADRPLILSLNVERRHLSKGQQAIALAMAYPNPEKGGRGKKGAVETVRVSQRLSADGITRARAVLRWSTGAAHAVMAGAISLDEAYQQQRQIEQDKEDETEAQRAQHA